MTREEPPPDRAAEVAAFIDERVAALAARLGPQHPWTNWPRFLYHVTDVRNAASILAAGRLLSRRRVEEMGLLLNDSASRRVIAGTDPWVLDSVRLYFRPRTATFFHSEGIRPVGLRSPYDAHCPVPVALLFDPVTILSRDDVRISDGNLATRRRRVGRGLSFLRSLPWEWVFHEGVPRTAEDLERATFHRQAEVVVPGELLLEGSVRFIGVRSQAELDTLRSLTHEVGGAESLRWFDRAMVDSRARFFFQRWSFVESVVLDSGASLLRVEFNRSTETPAPFEATMEFEDPSSGVATRDVWSGFRADRAIQLPLPDSARLRPFRFRIFLDECLAFAGSFDPTTRDVLIGRT